MRNRDLIICAKDFFLNAFLTWYKRMCLPSVTLLLSKPEYYDKPSPASKGKLSFQGDVMCDTEAAEFENNPDAQLVIRMRHWERS